MIGNFDRSLRVVLSVEGGYSNHPGDPGGPTNFGITKRTLSRWRGRTVTSAEVKVLSRDEAATIYKAEYWQRAGCNDFPAGVDLAVFDLAVHSGPKAAKKVLQKALRVKVDGLVGRRTMAAVLETEPQALIRDILALRAVKISSISHIVIFGYGWFRRLFNVHAQALAMSVRGDVDAG